MTWRKRTRKPGISFSVILQGFLAAERTVGNKTLTANLYNLNAIEIANYMGVNMAKVICGNHASVFVPRQDRDKIRKFYGDVLGGKITRELDDKMIFKLAITSTWRFYTVITKTRASS